MQRLVAAAALTLLSLMWRPSMAGPLVVFPELIPKVDKTASAPRWLPGGRGDDGYLTIRADLRSNEESCKQLGNPGLPFVGLFKEKLQIVVNLTTSGFRSNLDGQDIPIAIFDGRSSPKSCIGLNTLPSVAVPYARLERFSEFERGDLKLLLNVRSTTDAELNLVPAAQAALGIVAVFATGGAASTISGLTSLAAKPAFAELEKRIEVDLSNVIQAQTPYPMTWQEIRAGLRTISIPVYVAEGNSFEHPAAAIARIRGNPSTPRTKLFDVVLSFSYTKTLFDRSLETAEDLPGADAVARERVLLYPPSGTNFLQLLSAGSPSLMQAISGASSPAVLEANCSKAREILDSAGLNSLDRAIVLKAFIDEAKQSRIWYNTQSDFDACFRIGSDLRGKAIAVFGTPNAQKDFEIQGVQLNGDGEEHVRWREAIPPILSELRRTLSSADGRVDALISRSGGEDIDFSIAGSPMTTWTGAVQASSAEQASKVPIGIYRLASNRAVLGGCFIYGERENLKPPSFGGRFIIKDDRGVYWNLLATLDPTSNRRVKSVQVQKLDNEWLDYFKTSIYRGNSCQSLLVNAIAVN